MVIEFADPGIDWTPVFWALPLLGLGLVLFVVAFLIPDRVFEDWMPVPGFLVGLVGVLWVVIAAFTVSSGVYYSEVNELTVSALEAEGFSEVTLTTAGEFTASDDGEYFRGALIDLNPDSGYRYQVAEMVGVE